MTPEEEKFKLAKDFKDVLLAKVDSGDVPLDFRGHFQGSSSDFKNRFNGTAWLMASTTKGVSVALLDALETGIPAKTIHKTRASCLFVCPNCSEEVQLQTDGTKIESVTVCPHPDGFPPIEFYLNVPSGRMVVGNDFRDKFRIIGDYNVNYVSEQAKTSHKYAETGLAHGFVGNTCPGVFKLNDKTFGIGCRTKSNPIKGSKQVASICTDLWWYSIADYDQYLKRYETIGDNVDVVKCEPGLYKFTHQHHCLKENDKTQLYAKIEWVSDPLPVKDYEAEFMKLNFTAGQVIYKSIHDYEDLYNGADGVLRAACQALSTAGSGRDWHPNGWSYCNQDIPLDTPDMPIPVFEEQYYWYPLDEHSFLAAVAGVGDEKYFKKYHPGESRYLNESFTALAFNILRCIVLHGIKLSEVSSFTEKRAKETRQWASKILIGLANKYPERIPENCVELLNKV